MTLYIISAVSPAFNERIIPISVPKGNERTLEERKGKTPTASIYEKASHETKPLQGRSITTRKPQGNDFSRVFNCVKIAWVAGLGPTPSSEVSVFSSPGAAPVTFWISVT